MNNIVCDGDICHLAKDHDSTNHELDDHIEINALPTESSLPMPSEEMEWTVYGTSWCPYCKKADELLTDKESYQYVDIEEYTDTHKFKDEFDELTNGYAAIPMIFNRKTFIGGYTDLLNIYTL